MARYARGDDGAFGDVYDALAPRLLGFLVRRCRTREAAEDLLQQTFLHVHRARGGYAIDAHVMPWVFAIARRLMIDLGRREGFRATDAVDPALLDIENTCAAPSPESMAANAELARILALVVAGLPEGQREAFSLVKIEGLSSRDAAQVLGTTEAGVKLRSHRACVALRAALARFRLPPRSDP